MRTDVQGRALSLLSRVAQSDWPDRFKLRKRFENLIYRGSRAGFRAAAQRSGKSGKTPRAANPDGLFDLTLSDDQQMLVEMLEAFASKALRPLAEQADADACTPSELVQQVHELGLTHYAVPEALDGMAGERTTVTNALIAEALGKGDLSLAATLLQPLAAANCIRRWGSDAQQARWLPPFIGEQAAPAMSIAVAEPGVMFDVNQLATRARKRGRHYLISGEKCLVLGGVEPRQLIVAAQASDGPALFVVDAGAKGLQFSAQPAMGLKAGATARVRLHNVQVHRDARLNGKGFNYQQFVDYASLAWCALAVGTTQAALDYVIPYCNEREAFGEPISHRQGVAFMVADMGIELEAMRLMVWRACARAEMGLSFQREAYLARLLCNEKAMLIGTNAVQLLGGHGFTKEHPVERWYRDLRALSVMAGGLQL